MALIFISDFLKLLEENGATSLGSSSSSTNNGASYRVPVEELKDIVRQCLRFSGSESSKVSETLLLSTSFTEH